MTMQQIEAAKALSDLREWLKAEHGADVELWGPLVDDLKQALLPGGRCPHDYERGDHHWYSCTGE